ncbi:hypothetical protein BLA29_010825 [Euroglyphus maynei]|uniref:Uncharacterized protein n=1 Tax=Euroglyphus maynei TaxID=6958 RepID=A0A1Y3B6L4_EURMA|nr:hypothetical protein BLA29_010825 [Euroglyphus maynei]
MVSVKVVSVMMMMKHQMHHHLLLVRLHHYLLVVLAQLIKMRKVPMRNIQLLLN